MLELDPELVVITGDIGDAHAESQRSADLAARLLEGVHPSVGCFAVLGNHDDPQLAAQLSGQVRIMSNEHVNLTKAGDSVMIAGIDGRTSTSGDIPSALLGIKPGSFTILLAHHPPLVYRLPPTSVHVMLAGHTPAGQIRLPLNRMLKHISIAGHVAPRNEEMTTVPGPVHDAVDPGPGHAGGGFHNGLAPAHQPVEEGRLAHVGPSEDSDGWLTHESPAERFPGGYHRPP